MEKNNDYSIFSETIKIQMTKFLKKYKNNNIININIDFINNFEEDIDENNDINNFIFDSCILYDNCKNKEKEFLPYMLNIISYYILCMSYVNFKMETIINENFISFKEQLIEAWDVTYLHNFEQDIDIIEHLTNGLYILNAIMEKNNDDISKKIIYVKYDRKIDEYLYSDNISDNFLKIKQILNDICVINEEDIKNMEVYFDDRQYNR